MNASIDCVPMTREVWVEIVSAISLAEMEPKMRRTTRRYSCDGEIKVSGVIDDVPFQSTWILMQVSVTGISARAMREIPDRMKVAIRWRWNGQEQLLHGRVMHCTQTIGGYKIGLRLDFPKN